MTELYDRRAVPLEEIDRQRSLGWPDFHPENYCHRCGGVNPSWFVDSDRFNMAMGPPEYHNWNGIVCPGCFVDLHEYNTLLTCTWQLIPSTPFRHHPRDSIWVSPPPFTMKGM